MPLPPWMVPRDSTAGFSGEALRETTVCSMVISWAAQTMASTPRWGRAAWPETPFTTMFTSSVEPFRQPGRVSIWPTFM